MESRGSESDDEEAYMDDLEKHHLEITNRLDLDRQFIFSYLRSKSVIDEEDCEIVMSAGPTRRQKVSKFLDIIKRKGEVGVKHFVESLEFENADLYEKFTGRKPIKKLTSVNVHKIDSPWDYASGSIAKDFVDFDRQVLVKELEHTNDRLHNMSILLQKTTEEKHALERSLCQALEDLEMLRISNAELQEKYAALVRASESGSSQENSDQINSVACRQLLLDAQMQCEKSNMIIALQAKALAQTEEMEQLRSELENKKMKIDSLRSQFRELTINYDYERRNSKWLNQQVMVREDEIKQKDDLTMEIRDLRYRLGFVIEERDELQKEYDEFRNTVEVFSAKYDVVAQEREAACDLALTQGSKLVQLQEKLNQSELRLKAVLIERDNLSKSYERVQSDVRSCRDIQRNLRIEVEQLRAQRDAALQERDRLSQDKSTHDELVHSLVNANNELEEKYLDVCEQLDDFRALLQQTNEELVKTMQRVSGTQSSQKSGATKSNHVDESLQPAVVRVDMKPQITIESVAVSSEFKKVSEPSFKEHPISDGPRRDPLTSGKSATMPLIESLRHRRSSKDLLNSIRKKMAADARNSPPLGLKNKLSAAPKGLLNYEQIWMQFGSVGDAARGEEHLPGQAFAKRVASDCDQDCGSRSLPTKLTLDCLELDSRSHHAALFRISGGTVASSVASQGKDEIENAIIFDEAENGLELSKGRTALSPVLIPSSFGSALGIRNFGFNYDSSRVAGGQERRRELSASKSDPESTSPPASESSSAKDGLDAFRQRAVLVKAREKPRRVKNKRSMSVPAHYRD